MSSDRPIPDAIRMYVGLASYVEGRPLDDEVREIISTTDWGAFQRMGDALVALASVGGHFAALQTVSDPVDPMTHARHLLDAFDGLPAGLLVDLVDRAKP